MSTRIRWGILGTGRIAGEFAEGLRHLQDANLTVVASRNQTTADAFASKYGVGKALGTYEALASDPDVDAVYIATPHTSHCDNTLLCLEGGKHVLCEKPFAVNETQVRTMIAKAQEKGLFLMEAMWMRFIPLIRELRQRLAEGVIGEVRMIQADFGFRVEVDPKKRLFSPDLAGGALLDVGIYPIEFSGMILGAPTEIVSLPTLGETGVDEQSAYILKHAKGQLSVLSSAIRTQTSQSAWIYGEKGRIHLSRQFWKASHMDVFLDGKEPESVQCPYEGNGYQFEAREVGECLLAGKLESSVMPHLESIRLIQTMDRIRRQWGLKYPME